MEDSEKIDFTAEALSLIDLSPQSDDQFSGKQTKLQSCELLGVSGAKKEVNNTLSGDVPELPESTDPGEKRRNGRCNLRKSLAWDSAFFSNAGVLDPEELSTMINGVEKDKNHLLPGIEEDIRRSIDSISTLESDNFTVESLEDDLFLDIRASIQRSSKRPPHATNCTTSKSVAMEIDNQAISTIEEESLASQNELPLEPTLKNARTQTVKTLKCPPKQNVGTHGSRKAIKHDSAHPQITKTVTKIDKSSSMRPKPTNATSRATLTSISAAKRDSTGSSLVNSRTGSSKLGTVTGSSKESRAPKVPILTAAKRVLPKPAPLSKSSSLGSSTSSKVPSTRSSTSSDSSDSMLSKTTAKSPMTTARRNPVKSSTVRPAPSSSIPKASSKAGVKNKPPSSFVSANMRSTKISSSVSPASSISEWSSVSSSSSSTIYRASSNTRNNIGISSSPSVDNIVVPLATRNDSTDQIAGEHESKGTAVSGNNLNRSSTQNASVQAPAKPSGLRMPSPKIGYFDGAKSLVRTPSGTPRAQSGLGNVLARSGAAVSSPRGSSNIKPKITKFPTARAASSLANVKSASPKARSPPSSSERSRASANDSRALTDEEDSPSFSPKMQSNRSGEKCLKPQKVHTKGPDENKQVIDAGNGDVKNENLGSGDIKIFQVKDTNALGSRSTGHTVDKDALDEQDRLKSSHLTTKTNEDKLSGPNDYENANATDSRAPFALKESFYNSECPDFSKELTVEPIEKVATPLPTTEQKENI